MTSKFELYLTDKGLAVLTDDIRINVMDRLFSCDVALVDLSKDLDVPLSTLFSNMNKMVESGLISTYLIENDKRKVMYYRTSWKVLSSVPSDRKFKPIRSNLLTSMIGDSAKFCKSVIMFFDSSSEGIGLNLNPIFEKAGRILAGHKKKEFVSESTDELMSKIAEFVEATGLMHMTYTDEKFPVITLKVAMDVTKSTRGLFSLGKGLVSQAYSDSMGFYYSVVTDCSNSDSTQIKFTLKPMASSHWNISDLRSVYENQNVADSLEYFEIFSTRHGLVYNSNSMQLRIIDELFVSPSTLSGLSKKLDLAQSTVFANLNRMVDAELITTMQTPTDNRSIYYITDCVRMIAKKSAVEGAGLKEIQVLEKAARDPSELCKSMFEFIILECDSIGVDISNFAKDVGMMFARIVGGYTKEKNVENMIRKISEHGEFIGAEEIIITTHIPLTIMITSCLEKTKSISGIIMSFYDGFFTMLLTIITGIPYRVLSKDEVEGEKVQYMYVIEADYSK